jgi:hypothetical protein
MYHWFMPLINSLHLRRVLLHFMLSRIFHDEKSLAVATSFTDPSMGRNRFEYSPAGLNELLAEPVIHPKDPAARSGGGNRGCGREMTSNGSPSRLRQIYACGVLR